VAEEVMRLEEVRVAEEVMRLEEAEVLRSKIETEVAASEVTRLESIRLIDEAQAQKSMSVKEEKVAAAEITRQEQEAVESFLILHFDPLFVTLKEAMSLDAHKGAKVSGVLVALNNIKNFIKKHNLSLSKQNPYRKHSTILKSVEVFLKECDVQDFVTRENFDAYQNILVDSINHFSRLFFQKHDKIHIGFYCFINSSKKVCIM
jgi:hypothetical protein